jgi:hypothetical protein
VRTNGMKLETFETFVVKLACGFLFLVLVLLLMGLMLLAGLAGSTSAQESQPRRSRPRGKTNSGWYFDTDAGKEEILARRVGKNELATIDVCYQLVDAQQQHYARSNEGEHRYALKFSGDNDGQDGLFSSENREQPVSPHDVLIASAGVENRTATSHDPVPFNGYYFRILTSQGKDAEGGAKSYLVNGKMLSGFAFVAYPAVYGSTGVMTFIVNQNGIVYQKDLGPDTEKIADAMTEYDPDSTWDRVE